MSYSKPSFPKSILDVTSPDFAEIVVRADAFICAAGFEKRAQRAVLVAAELPCRNPIVLRYKNGPVENDKTFELFEKKMRKCGKIISCELDFNHPEKFEREVEGALRQIDELRRNEIVVDISGMTNFALCTLLGKLRRMFPLVQTTLVYTEAKVYFPTQEEYERVLKREDRGDEANWPDSLSDTAVNNYEPAMFSGASLSHNDTCLMVFAGYEPHRTRCALDHANARRLIMVYGIPGRPDLEWRLDLSKKLHREIEEEVEMAEETAPTSDVQENLRLILTYYEYLYDDHTFCLCPINSKLQAVASILAWETYPDIQLRFPLPVNYLARRFSSDWGNTFKIELGAPLNARKFVR